MSCGGTHTPRLAGLVVAFQPKRIGRELGIEPFQGLAKGIGEMGLAKARAARWVCCARHFVPEVHMDPSELLEERQGWLLNNAIL